MRIVNLNENHNSWVWWPLISKIGLDRATHMSRGAKNEAREIQSAPYWSDHFRDIVVIGC